jgi:hypothetical protein
MPEYILSWDEFARLSPLGMGIERVDVGLDGLPVIYGNPTVAAQAALDKARKRPGMEATLKSLYDRAEKQQPQPARIPNLGRGLGVDLAVGVDVMIRVQIYRQGKIPEDREWDTILKYFPFPVMPQKVQRFEAKGRNYIQAELIIVRRA